MMIKVDHRKIFKEFYQPRANQIAKVEVPEWSFLSIQGNGHPQSDGFQQAAESLYPLAYTIKFFVRERMEIDYHVMPMEVSWVLDRSQKGQFAWTMRLMQPEWVTDTLVQEAREKVLAKGLMVPRLDQVYFETLNEGPCIQSLHCGAYDAMNETLAKMAAWASERGLATTQDTHDIYLNDVRKTRPENLRTVMRVQILER